MRYSRITGTGSYLPKNRLSNEELAKTVDTTDEWIRERTGISARHIAAEGEFTSDLAVEAAKKAIEASGLDAQDIDLIIVATSTPDLVFPSTASIVQEKLGIRGCPAFDVQAVCAGFAYGLSVGDQFVRGGGASKVLVIGAETFSRILDWSDRRTCVLFGDGAGAVVLEASDQPGIHSTHIHADGRFKDLLCVPSGVSKQYKDVIDANAFVQMDGQKVFRWAVKEMGNLAKKTLEENQLSVEDLDWMVPHQANIRIIEAVAQKAGVPMDKVVVTVDQHGNTSAASVPLALDTAVRDGRIQPGHKIIIEAFGGGFTWGSALITM
ncbi:MAG: 3-oxoacyl-[acyl-carrier-protein] synthase-3 [Saprospiraceae bacterium]|jgi:3-oxoacyl-[acyl-carrier-protein] synthase-3